MSIFDQYIGLGVESAYATAVAPTRSLEFLGDDWERQHEYVESAGFRQNRQTIREDRRRRVVLGATGSVELVVMSNGMGLLLQHLLGASTAPSQIATTGVYEAEFETDDSGPSESYTFEVIRQEVDVATLERFVYAGCVPMSFSLAAAVGEDVRLTIGYDAASETAGGSPAAAAYPTVMDKFIWEDVAVSIGGDAATSAMSFGLDGELAMKTDRHYLKGSALKSQPLRNGTPSYSGSVEMHYDNQGQERYANFIAGEIVPIVLTATQPQSIGSSGTNKPKLTVTLPKCQFDGSTPKASTEDLTMIALPFKVLQDKSSNPDPAITFATVSTDDAF